MSEVHRAPLMLSGDLRLSDILPTLHPRPSLELVCIRPLSMFYLMLSVI